MNSKLFDKAYLICTIISMGLILFLSNGCTKSESGTSDLTTSTVTDVEGNIYKTVKIGTQIWMAENLKVTKYNDGTAIPNITPDANWAALTTGAYCDYANTPATSTTYGRLYNWFAVDNNALTKMASNGGKNVCPTSWHVPSDAEWTTLTTNLGEASVAYVKLKETGITHWQTPNEGATNETGFSALPGGFRSNGGTFDGIGYDGVWWMTDGYYPTWARCINMSYRRGMQAEATLINLMGFLFVV